MARAREALPGLAGARARRAGRAAATRWPTRSTTHHEELACSRRATPASRSPTRAARWRWWSTPSATTPARPSGLLGDTIPVAGGQAFTVREPLGVVGLIVPWNFPLTIAAWKLGPALAAGNTVVLKPAELTPLTALRFAEIATEAGLPEGVVNVVVGPGRDVRAAAGRAPRRGQDRVHRLDRGRALDRRRRGGDDQAGDARARRQVAEHRLRRRRPRGGRRGGARGPCSATPARTAARARGSSSRRRRSTSSWRAWRAPVTAIRVGDPLDEATEMGPLISAGQRETVALVRRRRRAGGDPRQRARTGPATGSPPTVLCPVDPTPARRARRSSARWRR